MNIREPDCLFRRQSLDRLSRSIRPAVQAAVETVAIPELSRRHVRTGARAAAPRPGLVPSPIGELTVARFVSLLTSGDAHPARRMIESLRDEGVSLDVILLELMCSAEAGLHRAFAEDRCSSADVTLGVCRLRTLAFELTRGQHRGTRATLAESRRACIIGTASDHFTFSPLLHQCYLQMAGWDVLPLVPGSADDVEQQLTQTDPELALCVLNDSRLMESTAHLLRRVRELHGEGALPRFVGVGSGFACCGGCPMLGGLDDIASDPAQTLRIAATSHAAASYAAAN